MHLGDLPTLCPYPLPPPLQCVVTHMFPHLWKLLCLRQPSFSCFNHQDGQWNLYLASTCSYLGLADKNQHHASWWKTQNNLFLTPTGLNCVSGPYAGGVQGVRTNHSHSGRGPQGCMCLHGAWPPCMAIASGRAVVTFKLARLLFRRLNMHRKSYV